MPHLPLAVLPTPVRHHPELGAALGVGSFHILHDDESARPYGGGKVRKLEFFLADARAGGHSAVVTAGAVGSHHATATAIYARQLGLDCHLLLMHGRGGAETRQQLLANVHHGATVELVGGPGGVAAAIAQLTASPEPPYVIPGGGTAPLGNLGYVNAALELEQQVMASALPAPDWIVVAMGTMGTAVGLTLGLELTQLSTRVLCVRASNIPTSTHGCFATELAATRAWLAARGALVATPAPDRFHIEAGYLGEGYGFPTDRGRAAQRLADAHGVSLELTYTAKALAAVIGHRQQLATSNVLFWHTHSAWEPPVGDTSAEQLPSELRGYVP